MELTNYKRFIYKAVFVGIAIFLTRAIFKFPIELFDMDMLKAYPSFSKIDALKAVVIVGLFFALYFRDQLSKLKHPKTRIHVSVAYMLLAQFFVVIYYTLRYFLNSADYGFLNYVIFSFQGAMLVLAFIFICVSIFQHEYIQKLLKEFGNQLVWSGLAVAILYLLLIYFQGKWFFFSSLVSQALFTLLTPLYEVTLQYTASGPVMSFNAFNILIGAPCSGIDSMLLFLAFCVGLFALDYNKLNWHRFALAAVLGLFGVVLVNILRLVLLVVVGVHLSPELAVGLFHTNAGWLLFVLYFLFFYYFIRNYIYGDVKTGFKRQAFFLALFVSDIIMYGLSILATFIIFFSAEGILYLVSESRFFIFALLILLINYSHFNLYRNKRTLFDENDVMHIAYSIIITYFIIILFMMLFGVYATLLHIVITISFVIAFVATSSGRFILYQIRYAFRRAGFDRKCVVFFGKNKELADRIKENKSLGYVILQQTTSITVLKRLLHKVDIVFITEEMNEQLLTLIVQNDRIKWKIISSAFNLIVDPVAFDEFKDYPIVNVAGTMHVDYFLKRFMDFWVSGLTLVFLSPLFLLIAAIIKITMPGPVFFKQARLGKDLKPFMVYKFRSMVVDAEQQKKRLKSEVRGLFKMKNDPRITPFGRFLRRSALDELPQLINIFNGDMSIVGPRPFLKKELKFFKGWRMARFKVMPGLTGMWQVNGRHELNIDKAILYDIYYVKHMSFVLDILIILKTIPSILMSRGKH